MFYFASPSPEALICHSRNVCRAFVSKNYPIYWAEEWRQMCGLRRRWRTEIALGDKYWGRQSVAAVASSAGLCDEQGTAEGSDCSYGCLLVLQELLIELLHCRKLWLSYSIAETSGWITPLQEPVVELLHCRNLWLNYSIAGTSGWLTLLQEPLAELLHCKNLWLTYSIAGTSGWLTLVQEHLAELFHCRNLWLNYSIAGTSVWITQLQEPLVELLHCKNLWLD
jgi:hypothetical protein